MTHQFDIDVAKNIGIHQAILLNNLFFWIEKNRHNNQNFYSGKYWTYNSRKAFSELFPYMSERQITYYLADMKKKGIIITGNYNSNLHDRTLWYAITDLGYSILKNGKIDITKTADGYDENVKCIYNNNNSILCNTDNKPYINADKCVSADGNSILVDGTNDNPQTSLAPQNNELPTNKSNVMSSNKVEHPKIYKDVIDYLNKKANTKYRHTTPATQRHIKARQNEGFTLQDFYAVIDVKCSQWLNDKNMSKYLRPETLFNSEKFESYLNENNITNTSVVDEKTEFERLKETDPVEYEKRRPAF